MNRESIKCKDFLCNKALFCKIENACRECESYKCENCLRKENCDNADKEGKYCFTPLEKNKTL